MTAQQFQSAFIALFLSRIQHFKPNAPISIVAGALHDQHSLYSMSLETEYGSDKDRRVYLVFAHFQDDTTKVILKTVDHNNSIVETRHVGEAGSIHMLAARLAQHAFEHLALAS